MSGIVHNVITKRQFEFSNVTGLGTLDVPLVRAIEVADAKAFDLVVRVHALTVSSSAKIEIKARSISLTNEEPNTDFTNSIDLVTVTLDTSTGAAPLLAQGTATGDSTTVFGHMIRIFIRGTQAASPVTLTATLSIDLVIRDN